MSEEPKFEGEKHRLGKKEYIIPALNWKRIRKLLPVLGQINLSTVGTEITTEMLDNYAQVIYEAITRNYPKFTRDELEENLDLGNAPKIFLAIMGMSGLIQGELRPGIISPSIGEPSTPI